MSSLFGIPVSAIAIVLGALLCVSVLTVLTLGLANRTMFKFGLRNIPRRGLQSVLVVTGLALATLITTAAFVTGDTVDNSLSKDVYKVFGRSDLDITWTGERDFGRDQGAVAEGDAVYADGSAVDTLEQQFANDPDIAAFLPFLALSAPVTNEASGDAKPAIQVTGVDFERLGRVGGLALLGGGTASVDALGADGVFLSERAAEDLHASVGDTLTVYGAEGRQIPVTVARIVQDELASGVLGMSFSTVPGGLVLPIERLREIAGFEDNEITSLTVALQGDVRTTADLADGATDRIQAYLDGEGAGILGTATEPEVFAAKNTWVEDAEETGNLFVMFFLVLGLFSMAAGVMLIFMIFVMLAAERRSEMGMARAVGAQRGHLVRSFLAEGMAYSLLAGVIGVAAGVLCSWLLVDVLLKAVGGDYFSLIEMQIRPTALVIGYSLGVVLTFVTVIFASLKASHVNIVAAIRQLPDERHPEPRRKTRWRWVLAGFVALVVPPIGVWWMLRKGFGLPWAVILAPVGVLLGALFMLLGRSSEMLFPFALGISLIPLSLAPLASRMRVPGRVLWTTVGVLLVAYWLMPQGTHDSLFGKFDSGIEMFVLSGIMIVIGATLVIVFNARLLTNLFTSSGEGARAYSVAGLVMLVAAAAVAGGIALRNSGDGLGQLLYLAGALLVPAAATAAASAKYPALAPALKMAVAYPLSNRFRTGMTIAMFSLIVFSLTVFSVLLANFDTAFLGGDAQAKMDLVTTSSGADAVDDVPAALEQSGSPAAAQIAGSGRTTIAASPSKVSQPGVENEGLYPVLAADEAFYGNLGTTLAAWANGYGTEAAVFQAAASDGALALVDTHVVGMSFGDYDWAAEEVTVEDDRFEAFPLTITDPATGNVTTVTVIGVLRTQLPSATVSGIYLNETAYTAFAGAEPEYRRGFMRLVEGADSREVARQVESALAVQGVKAESVDQVFDDMSATQTAFNRMFQAFMALGLLVGIAGLGVIAFRSVVERRQQIGMLRAIGYQRGTVTLTFLLESSFVAVMGILSGVVGGAILGRNLLTSEQFTDGADITFAMPWSEITIVIVASFIFSLLMTWWPSRGASRVPVAEALRYE